MQERTATKYKTKSPELCGFVSGNAKNRFSPIKLAINLVQRNVLSIGKLGKYSCIQPKHIDWVTYWDRIVCTYLKNKQIFFLLKNSVTPLDLGQAGRYTSYTMSYFA